MLLASAAIIVGFVILVWSADLFVEKAAITASNFGVSTFVIGVTVIGFGTSAPEILISTIASLDGASTLAVGNAIGSNIANTTLILGTAALLAPLAASASVARRDLPLLFATMLALGVVLVDHHLGRLESGILLLLFFINMFLLLRSGEAEEEVEIPDNQSTLRTLAWLVLALLCLVGSSKVLVWGAVEVARYWGISELVIGLTIIAVGSSLPELAAAVAGARKGQSSMVMGNIVGSNLFNSLIVLPIAGLIAPSALPNPVFSRDYAVMLAVTAGITLLFWLGRNRSNNQLARPHGLLLLAVFVGYIFYLITSTTA